MAIGLYLNANRELLSSLSNLTFWESLALVFLRCVIIGMNGLFLKAFTTKFGKRLVFVEWFGLAAVTTMGNYFTPLSGGLVARATYLKMRHGLPLAHFSAILAANSLVMFWVVAVGGIAALIVFGYSLELYWPVFLVFTGTAAAISIVMLIPRFALPGSHSATKAINTALEGWAMVKADYALLARISAYTVITMLVNGICFWVAYRALGFPVSIPGAFVISLTVFYTMFFTFTPGGIGVQELIVSAASESMDIGAGQGLMAILLIRAAVMLAAFGTGAVFSVLLARLIRNGGNDPE